MSASMAMDMSSINTSFGLGLENITNYDTGVALVANGSIPMKEVHENFSVEVDTRLSLLTPSFSNAFSEASFRNFLLGGYATYTHPVTSEIDVRARAGINFVYASATVKTKAINAGLLTIPASETTSSTNDFEVAYGFGGSYDLGDDQKVYVDYTVLGNSYSHISAMMAYQF